MPASQRRQSHKGTREARKAALAAPHDVTGSPDVEETSPAPVKAVAEDSTAAFEALHKPSKPSARAKAGEGRLWTLSIALPGSILLNAQSPELKAALVGQVARACAIFAVDEVVVFNEPAARQQQSHSARPRGKYRDPDADRQSDPNHFMAILLAYLECPQYLRKSMFPLDPALRLAGLLPPLDLPHHARREDEARWREGCVVASPDRNGLQNGAALATKKRKGGARSAWVNVGLAQPVEVQLDEDATAHEGARVTVRMPESSSSLGRLVSPREPTETAGLCWGYSVRSADSISKVLTESPFAATGGYDVVIGTSERGVDVGQACDEVEPFQHMLVVFGGLSGLELTVAADDSLEPRMAADEADLLFDHWVNSLPGQGSRTVRTEEALLVTLQALRPTMLARGKR